MIGKKRLALAAGSVTAVGAVATLIAGTTFGLFSASQGSNSSSFATGDVTIGNPVNDECTVTNMVPGDSSSGYSPTPTAQTNPQTDPCSFAVDYTGSAPAYLAIDFSVGGSGLYDGSADGLQLQIKDDQGTEYTTSGLLNGTTNLLVSTSPDDGISTVTHTFTVNYALPRASGNTYADLNSTITMTVHAVQAGNNALPVACATAGQPCAPSGDFSWS